MSTSNHDVSNHDSQNFLKVLVDPESPNVDIIAIHGLNPVNAESHAKATWTAGGRLWLKDFLPVQLPNARVLLFGYNANVVFNTSTAGVKEQAANLLNRTFHKRRGAKERPIVFIAHSLGGLIVKQALVEAKLDQSYKSISDATYGIVFFGTPHNGSGLADIGSIALKLVNCMRRKHPGTFITALSKDSDTSKHLRTNFRHSLEDYRILSFYETQPMGHYGIIVSQESATLGLAGTRETQIAMDSSHTEICKFANAEDDNYEQVSDNLVDLVEHAVKAAADKARLAQLGAPPSVPMLEPAFIIPYTKNPAFVDRQDISEPLRKELQIDSAHQPLVALWGLGGVGKSQIAIEYAYWHRQTFPEDSIFWIHASNSERFSQGFLDIAQNRNVPGLGAPNTNHLALVKTWLCSKQAGRWVMIIDNADDDGTFFGTPTKKINPQGVSTSPLRDYIPECNNGAILVTTKNKIVGQRLTRGSSLIEVIPMNPLESIEVFRKQLKGDFNECHPYKQLSEELSGLPLALTQAASFMLMNSITAEAYLSLISKSDANLTRLLHEQCETVGRDSEIPNSVMATWTISFEYINRAFPLAAELLSRMAMLDRQGIPEALIHEDSVDRVDLTKAIGILRAFSFITANEANDLFGMHRLIHLATRHWLRFNATFDHWARTCLISASKKFPFPAELVAYSETCESYYPHAMSVLSHWKLSADSNLSAAILAFHVASYLKDRCYLTDAEILAAQALQAFTETLGDRDLRTLKSMCLLATVITLQGRLEDAEKLYIQLLTRQLLEHKGPIELRVKQKVFTDEDSYLLKTVSTLANLLVKQGKHDLAGELYEMILMAKGMVLGAENVATLTSMIDLANTLQLGGWCERANKLYEEAMRRYQQNWKLMETVIESTDMRKVAFFLTATGDYVEAERIQWQAIKTNAELLGVTHRSMLSSIFTLAETMEHQRRYEEAEMILTWSVEVQENTPGITHLYRPVCLSRLASVQYEQGRYRDASINYYRAYRRFEEMLGSHHHVTMACLKICHDTLGLVYMRCRVIEDLQEQAHIY